MNILQICAKPPYPTTDGGCKAMAALANELLTEHDVKVLTVSTKKHPFHKKEFPKNYLLRTEIEAVFVNTSINVYSAFLNLFSTKSYNITRFYNKKFNKLIVKTLKKEKFDIILLEGLFVTPYINSIRKHGSGKIIYRAHNIESEIWERRTETTHSLLKKSYLMLLTRKLKNYEQSILNTVDGIASITNKDKQKLLDFGCRVPIENIPFGVDRSHYESSPDVNKHSLFHIGSMDWAPNQAAVEWFLENVWDDVANQFPDATFYLAGKKMPKWLIKKKQKNLVVVGEVKSAIDFINQNEIMIVPLFVGSGMRIKIIEAMALGKTVIATSIAAEGITYKANESILIANTAEEFIDAISKCLTDIHYTKRIGNNARNMVAVNYNNTTIVNHLVEFFKSIAQ